MGIGWVVYFTYGIRHSKFNRDPVGRFAEGTMPEGTQEDKTGYQYEEYEYVPENQNQDPQSHRS
jgi:APA family basic amino acid/polyamine antiporter